MKLSYHMMLYTFGDIFGMTSVAVSSAVWAILSEHTRTDRQTALLLLE